MTHFKKLTAALVATSAIIATNHAALAVDQDIGATAEFRAAVSLANVTDMDYGVIDHDGTANGNNITLDANGGTITCSNTTNFTCPATGTVGSADINGTTGQTVDISCEATGVVSDGTNTMNLDTAEVRIGGTDTACAGLGTSPVAFVLTAGTDTLNIGARLVVPGTGVAADGTYNTSLAGGDPIAVRVVYQ